MYTYIIVYIYMGNLDTVETTEKIPKCQKEKRSQFIFVTLLAYSFNRFEVTVNFLLHWNLVTIVKISSESNLDHKAYIHSFFNQ